MILQRPPQLAIDAAVGTARLSPCAKSKRGVVVYASGDSEGTVVASTFNGGFAMAAGYNGPPGDLICTGSAQCHKVCTDRCVHAEIRAIRHAAAQLKAPLSALRAVHVKVVDDALVAGGPPSCTSCAREVLDVGLQSFWLYQECIDEAPRWRQYTAREFYDATANFCGAEISL